MKHFRLKDLLLAAPSPRLTGKVTVTHNATSLWLPGESDLTFDNGDIIRAVSDGSGNWRVIDIQKNSAPARGKITTDKTYYVRTDGNDSNTGLSNTSGGAYLTIQRAVDEVASNIDIAAKNITIQIADGTYTGAVVLKNVVGFSAAGNLVIKGNATTPANVVVSVTGADAFSADGISTVWDIKDLKITTATTGNGLFAGGGAKLRFGNINFGSCAYAHMQAFSPGSVITALSNYAVSGGSGNAHMQAYYGAQIVAKGLTVTITNTPSFPIAWIDFEVSGTGQVFGNTYSGSATGKRFVTTNGSVIFTNGSTPSSYFPGDAAGQGTNFATAPYGLYA